jgi:Tfp pilus assembly protein PilV
MMSKLLRSIRPHRRQASAAGFSLVELLIYVALAGGVLAMITGVTVSNIRSTSNIELRLRTADLWGRISSLIESEISEADGIKYNETLPSACVASVANSPTVSSFSLQIPHLNSTSSTSGALPHVSIHYYQVPDPNPPTDTPAKDNDLWRCGPGYTASGQLNYTGPVGASILGKRTTICTTCDLTRKSDERSLSFMISMSTPKGETINVHPPKKNNDDDDDDDQSNILEDQTTTIRTGIQTVDALPTVP